MELPAVPAGAWCAGPLNGVARALDALRSGLAEQHLELTPCSEPAPITVAELTDGTAWVVCRSPDAPVSAATVTNDLGRSPAQLIGIHAEQLVGYEVVEGGFAPERVLGTHDAVDVQGALARLRDLLGLAPVRQLHHYGEAPAAITGNPALDSLAQRLRTADQTFGHAHGDAVHIVSFHRNRGLVLVPPLRPDEWHALASALGLEPVLPHIGPPQQLQTPFGPRPVGVAGVLVHLDLVDPPPTVEWDRLRVVVAPVGDGRARMQRHTPPLGVRTFVLPLGTRAEPMTDVREWRVNVSYDRPLRRFDGPPEASPWGPSSDRAFRDPGFEIHAPESADFTLHCDAVTSRLQLTHSSEGGTSYAGVIEAALTVRFALH